MAIQRFKVVESSNGISVSIEYDDITLQILNFVYISAISAANIRANFRNIGAQIAFATKLITLGTTINAVAAGHFMTSTSERGIPIISSPFAISLEIPFG